MAFSIEVTQTIVTSYEFETEAEAKAALDSGDYWHHDSELIDSEVLDVQLVKL